MDPITVSASILSIVQLVNDATRLFKRLQTLDEKKVSILYFKLMAEKTIMTTWANRMRLLNGDDLRKAVPPENFQDVMEIIEKLDQVFEEANKNLHSVIALGGEKLKPGNLKARFLWVSIGYEQLKESIELLETLNRALGIKAPGLPPYSPPGRGSDVVSAQATTEVTSSSALGSTTLAENPMNSEPSPGKEAPRTTLRTVYRLCLGTLRVIGAQVSPLSLAVRTVSSRLEMCATGFFEEPYPLDEILESHRKRCDPLREYILRTFIDIAIAEEEILKRMVYEKEEAERSKLEETRVQITLFLGTDEMFPIALKKWQNSLQGLEEADSLAEDVQFIGEVVETLFDLLPSVRSMRREYLLFLEASEKRAKEVEVVKSDPAAVLVDAEKLIFDNLEAAKKIESALQERENKVSTSKQGKSVQLFSPMFRKERERLEELRFTAAQDQLVASRLNTSIQVGKMQAILAKTLEACGTSLMPDSDSKTSQKGQPESLDLGEDSLRRALQAFHLANSHLSSSAQG